MFPLPVARSPIGCRLERRGRSHEKTSLQRMVEVGKKTELGPEERTPERTRPSGAEKPGGRGRGLGGNSRPPSAPIATMARSGRWAMPQDSRDTGVRGVSGPSDPDEEPFGELRHKDRWCYYMEGMNEGESVRKAAWRCGINREAAFNWRQRFLTLPEAVTARHETGIVEADETSFWSPSKDRGIFRGFRGTGTVPGSDSSPGRPRPLGSHCGGDPSGGQPSGH